MTEHSPEFEKLLRTVCFQKPTPQAYSLAQDVWNACQGELSATKAVSVALQRDITNLNQQVERLKGYLNKYGKHRNDPGHFCSLLIHTDRGCDCGWDKAKPDG